MRAAIGLTSTDPQPKAHQQAPGCSLQARTLHHYSSTDSPDHPSARIDQVTTHWYYSRIHNTIANTQKQRPRFSKHELQRAPRNGSGNTSPYFNNTVTNSHCSIGVFPCQSVDSTRRRSSCRESPCFINRCKLTLLDSKDLWQTHQGTPNSPLSWL
jgi:hypothetical protein